MNLDLLRFCGLEEKYTQFWEKLSEERREWKFLGGKKNKKEERIR